ncbi:BON domain-containing protein, partial [Chloroflexota bacterium]
QRIGWTKFLYHVDWNDPHSYDLNINLQHISLTSACDIVCAATSLEEYKMTPGWQKTMDDLTLSTHVMAILTAEHTMSANVEVKADSGTITITGAVQSGQDESRIKEIVGKIEGVKAVNSRVYVRSVH